MIKNVCRVCKFTFERERERDNDECRIEKNSVMSRWNVKKRSVEETCLNDRSVWTWTKEIVGWCRSLARFWSRSRFNIGSWCFPERFTGPRSSVSSSAIWLLSLSASFHLGIINVATDFEMRSWNSGSINQV